MMAAARLIARDEWRYWQRSKLLRAAAVLSLILLVSAIAVTYDRVQAQAAQRSELQAAAETAFTTQPDRHPHRMVHYGHYVFRAPPPLAVIDPGVDRVTGTALFLEGHRQNSAAFPPAHADARAGALGHLTPAFVYQIILPLLLVLMAHGALTREREGGTGIALVSSGVSASTLWAGKALALLSAVGLLLVPLLLVSLGAALAGESLPLVGVYFLAYALYLSIWALGTLALSAAVTRSAVSLALALGAWALVTLVLPPTTSSLVRATLPTASRLADDVALAQELRSLGDGHNENDPAFSRLRANLLEEYEVERVEDLPVNFRGVVAQSAEADLTELMNRYADQRHAYEQRQARRLSTFGLLSPQLALRQFSRVGAGTDLATHHRFLQEGEAARFALVQQLNGLHANELRYTDDINRSRNAAAERRSRISAHHWRDLESFHFEVASAPARLASAAPSLLALILWGALTAFASLTVTRRSYG